jgi:hypothetical protein
LTHEGQPRTDAYADSIAPAALDEYKAMIPNGFPLLLRAANGPNAMTGSGEQGGEQATEGSATDDGNVFRRRSI